jgi:SAM-dependent methyltransferase
MYQSLKKGWKEVEDSVIGTRVYYSLTPTSLSLMRALEELSKKYVKGRLLDIGAGRLTHQKMLSPLVDSYISLDKFLSHPELDLLADLLNGLPFKDESFDSIFCSQVLEHLFDPKRALKEIYRILKKDGYLILSVPHLSYIHGAPEDYLRYTSYGIKNLFEEARLVTVKIEGCGGLISFILTPIFMMSLIATHRLPLINKLFFLFNRICSKLAVWIDDLIDKHRIYAVNYVAVGQK